MKSRGDGSFLNIPKRSTSGLDDLLGNVKPKVTSTDLHYAVFLRDILTVYEIMNHPANVSPTVRKVLERNPDLVKIPKDRRTFGFFFMDFDEGEAGIKGYILNRRNPSGVYYLDAQQINTDYLENLIPEVDIHYPESEEKTRLATKERIKKIIDDTKKGQLYVLTRNGLIRRFNEEDSIIYTGERRKTKPQISIIGL